MSDQRDILDDLKDLHKQATTERSHYYVASCANRAIAEIERLRRAVITLSMFERRSPVSRQERS